MVPTPAGCHPEKKWCQLADQSEQGRQLAHGGQGSEEEPPGADHHHEGGHDHGHGALAARAQERTADLATEAVTPRAVTEIVEVVEVGVLAEGRRPRCRSAAATAVFSCRSSGTARDRHDGVGRFESLMGQAREVAREPGAPVQLQAPHLGVGEQAMGRELLAQGARSSARCRAFQSHAPATALARCGSRASTATTTSPRASSAA